MAKNSRPDEALRKLMAQRAGQSSSAKLPPKNSEIFARQLLRQALEGDVKTQKLIVELLEDCGQPQQPAQGQLELVLRVVGNEAGV